MAQAINIKSMSVDPALLDLPWNIPLEQWPPEVLAALPRGISRHIVRFVNLNSNVIAVKEISSFVADREYEMLRDLLRLGAPCVRPIAVITGRTDANGEELNSVLITEHLSYSLPYRALFSQYMRPETATRLIDALAVLLVRLHLLGSSGETCLYPTRSLGATPGLSQPTWLTPKPASFTLRASPLVSACMTLSWPAPTSLVN